jgi:hypothetical protein
MRVACTFVLDPPPGTLPVSLDEHTATCRECARTAALRSLARETWRRAKDRDEERDAAIRVRRIAIRGRDWKARKNTGMRPALALAALTVLVALFAATAAAMVREVHRAREDAPALVPVVRVPRALSPSALAGSVSLAGASSPEMARETPAPVRVEAGAELRAPALAAARPSATLDDGGEALWRAAEDALARGDRAAAESSLRALLRGPRTTSLATRGELRLAEILLARGASLEARAHLEPLVLGRGAPDANDRMDAAWLYVRTFEGGRGRAEAWRTVLAKEPAGPMRDLARVERARELHEAGDDEEARVLLERLESEGTPIAPVARDALRRLRERLGP